jgi:hypothetical protein
MRLKEMSPTKQAGGKGETEKRKQPACCTEEDGACLAEALYADAAIAAWGGEACRRTSAVHNAHLPGSRQQ